MIENVPTVSKNLQIRVAGCCTASLCPRLQPSCFSLKSIVFLEQCYPATIYQKVTSSVNVYGYCRGYWSEHQTYASNQIQPGMLDTVHTPELSVQHRIRELPLYPSVLAEPRFVAIKQSVIMHTRSRQTRKPTQLHVVCTSILGAGVSKSVFLCRAGWVRLTWLGH